MQELNTKKHVKKSKKSTNVERRSVFTVLKHREVGQNTGNEHTLSTLRQRKSRRNIKLMSKRKN